MTSLSTFDLFNVKGRVAVVTGGSSGIGLMISKVRRRSEVPGMRINVLQGLVTNGARVYLLALPSDPIAEIVQDLNLLGRDTGGSAEGYLRVVRFDIFD